MLDKNMKMKKYLYIILAGAVSAPSLAQNGIGAGVTAMQPIFAQAAVDAGMRNRNDLLQVRLRKNEI